METTETFAQWWVLPGLVAGAALVIWSGARAVHYGDLLGGKLGLSSLWVGLVMLAALTSLPELVVTVAAQMAVSRPGLVMSNVAGSNVFNLMIFPLLDLLEGPAAVSVALSRRLVKPALMGAAVMGLVVAGFLLPRFAPDTLDVPLGWATSLAVVAAYFYVMRHFTGGDAEEPSAEEGRTTTTARVALCFAAFSALLVGGGTALIFLCDHVIQHPLQIGPVVVRLQENLVGTMVLGIVTSLPELTVCLAALHMRSFDMAIGNILGSNIFNCTLLSVAHVIRPGSQFWSGAENIHVFSLGAAMVLSLVVAAGIRLKSQRAILRMGWDGLVVLVLGALTFYVIARYGISTG